MHNKYALIIDNRVVNIIVATTETVEQITGYEHIRKIATDKPASIGWTYDADTDTFAEPGPPAPPPRHITVGAFLLRFGQNMVPILTSTDPVVKALCILVQAMTYIDLDDARLTQQLPYLVQAKLLTLDELQDVLTAEIQPEERP